MKGQFSDEAAYQEMLSAEDTLVYEVYEITRPPVAGEVLHGLSIIHPGKVGREFFITKGHFHAVSSAEYTCA
jgi:glucose-6-phosphate isomerase